MASSQPTPVASGSSSSTSFTKLSYAQRIPHFSKNEAARSLLETMERKETNLCVSVDVTKKQDLIDVVEAVGQDVAMIKTHIDIVEDFDEDLIHQLTELSRKHDLLIFEDRKFADIGNTVSLQYSSGVHKIASWSHITNAHLVPGPGIIKGLAKVGQPLGRGLLLLAEMSSAGTLAKGDYSKACVEEAFKDESGYICGFIATSRVDERYAPAGQSRDFLVLTPGVGLDVKGDALGQQYRTPDEVVAQNGSDVIIVGRGIYGALLNEDVSKGDSLARAKAFVSVREQSQRYKEEGWRAYQKRIGASPKSSPRFSPSTLARTRKISQGSASSSDSRCRPYEDDQGVSVVFGYGSLIFKPPPHAIGRTVGYIKGYARRFAQSSNDHRGTPAQPGRVATLVCASQWHSLISNDDSPEGDIVWGVAWTIDPTKSREVRQYLDDREKFGYTPQSVNVYQRDEEGDEVVACENALIYVGLPDNEAFVGPANSLQDLAEYIYSCEGPSGRNDDYVLKLAHACRNLSHDVQDSHLFTLERILLELRHREGKQLNLLSSQDQREVANVIQAQHQIAAQ